MKIKIGADFGDVEKRFTDLFKTFDQFGKAGAAGVNAVTNAFSGLTKAAAVNVSTSLNRVINSLQTLGETGTGLGKVTDGLAKLRTAAAGAGLPGLSKAAEDLRIISARFEELQRTAGKLTPTELNVFATAISDLKREAAVFSPINITPSAESLRGINEIQAEIAEVKAEALAGVPPIVFKFDSEGNIDFKAAINELHGVRQAADLATTAVTKIPASLSTAAIDSLRTAVLGLKNDLSIGFKPVITIPKINIPPITVDVDTSASIAILDQLNQKIKSIEGLISIETDDIKLNELKNDLIKLQTEAHNIEVTIAPIEKTIIPVLDIRADDTEARNKLAALSGLVADTEKQILITTDTTELKLLQDRLAALHVQANEIQVTVEPIDIPKIDVPPIQIPTVSTASFDNVLKVIDELHAKAVEPLGLKADDATVRKTVADLQALLKATTQTISITTDDEQVKLLESKVVALKTRIENLQILVGIEIPPIDLPKITVPKIEVDADASLANQVIIQLQTLASSIKADIDITSDPADVRRLEDNLNAIQTRIRDVQIKVAPIVVPNISIPPIEIPNIQTTAFQGVFEAIDIIHQNALAAAVDVSKIPASLAAVDAAGIDSFRASVQALRKDIEAGFKPNIEVVPPSAIGDIQNVRAHFAKLVSELGSLAGKPTSIPLNTTSAIKSIDQLEDEIRQLEAQIRKTTDPSHMQRLGVEASKLKTQLNNIKVVGLGESLSGINKSAAGAAQNLSKLKPASNAANLGLTDLNRVVQDLPYGFIGIQNNLNPLFESFRRVRAETGSSGAAFKALGSSLLGAGGVGLAIAAISSAFVIYQNGIAGFNRKTKEAKAETDSFSESLKSVSSALAQEATKVSTLVNALQNGNLSIQQRKKALEELQGINTEFFGALKDEKGVVEALSIAYDNYLTRLHDIGRAKAIEAQIAKAFSRKLELELSIDPKFLAAISPEIQQRIGELKRELDALGGPVSTKQAEQSLKQLNEELIRTQRITKPGEEIAEGENKALQKRIGIQAKISEISRGYTFFQDKIFLATQREVQALDLQIKGLSELQAQTKNFNITPAGDKGKKEDPVLKSLKDQLQGFQKELGVIKKLRDEGLLPIFKENDALELQLKVLQKLGEIDLREVELKLKPTLEIDPQLNQLEIDKAFKEFQFNVAAVLNIKPKVLFDASIEKINIADAIKFDRIPEGIFTPVINRIKAFADIAKEEVSRVFIDIGPVIRQFVEDAAINIGEGIGNLISGVGSMEDVLKGFASVVGDTIITMGKMVVRAAIEVLLLKKAFQKLIITRPELAIAAGIAAIAVGTALKNAFNKQKVPQFEQGGIASGPQSGYLTMLHGKELIVPLNKALGNMGGGNVLVEVIGKTRGEDIYWATQRVIQRKGRI